MNQTFTWRVVLLVERIKSDFWVIGLEGRLHGDELSAQGIIQRVVPVDRGHDVWSDTNAHGCHGYTIHDIGDQIIAGSDVA